MNKKDSYIKPSNCLIPEGLYPTADEVSKAEQDASRMFKQFLKRAKRKDPQAQFNLGVCYTEGKGVTQNHKEAFKWFKKAAEQGDAQAQFNLGICYRNGEGITQNYEEAFKWFKEAAQQGDAQAQLALGFCYRNGEGIAQNYEEAFKWFEKAFKWFKEAAQQGDAQAQLTLGVCYRDGEGIAQNYEEAFKWLKEAAQQDDALAQLNLGICYLNGEGIAQNYEEAFKWFKEAAQQGDDQAQYNLGVCYRDGKGVTQNDDKAFNWFKKADEQGYARAQYALGGCYSDGKGVTQNDDEAIHCYEQIVAKKDVLEEQAIVILAQYALSSIYKNNNDIAKAIEYLHDITEDKEVDSSFLLTLQSVNEENQEMVTRVIRKVAADELIELERVKAKEAADKEMLSFLTHTLNNSLGTVSDSVKHVIELLGTEDYETDPRKFEAVYQMQSLSATFSTIHILIQTFKQYATDPREFQKSWEQDNTGSASIHAVLAFSVKQTLNRLLFELSNDYLSKFFPTLSDEACDSLRQKFMREIVLSTVKTPQHCLTWVENNFNIFEFHLEQDAIRFRENGKRYTLLFAIFSELIYNSIRYAQDKPIDVQWKTEGDFYHFSCKNNYVAENRYAEAGSKNGLLFIKRLLDLLKQSELRFDEQDNYFTVTVTLHKDNFA
ncbi:MAG: tetratricopeptide repeat protein [Thiotrichaceae bacterium]|nr:tetratricopeptide repeat protein [Thiotrichaceae bacterium]